MISDKYKCVFVHVPKTAGQSIELFFLNLHNITWKEKDQLLMSKNTLAEKGPERLDHMIASEYYDCGHMEKEKYDEYFSFAFVRNPWERLVSEYLHKKIDKDMTLKEFVISGLPEKNMMCDKYRHIIPQSEYLFDSDGKQLVTFIGKFERLQQDFDHICKQLGIEDSTLPHKNSSYSFRRLMLRKIRHLFKKTKPNKKHYSQYYDDELTEIVSKMYARDIELFGFKFERV